MKKMIYLDAQEIERYQSTISALRNDIDKYKKEINNLKEELNFLKSSGDEILVIVKNNENDIYAFKSTEKELLTKIVSENQKVREKHDNLIREKDNLDNQKNILLLKYHELRNQFSNTVKELNDYITFLEDRNLKDRILNIKKEYKKIEISNTEIKEEPEAIKTIYTDNEIKKLEADAKKIKKPRGWHFRDEFVDSEGNVYHKGKLQPHLKKNLTNKN